MKDESGMFEDVNFKLAVIEALLDKDPAFLADLQQLRVQLAPFEWYTDQPPIEALMNYFAALTLTETDLAKIDTLYLDGGNEIYLMLKPDWDGEDDLFDIVSVGGFEHLLNLETVEYMAMCEREVLEPMEAAGIQIED